MQSLNFRIISTHDIEANWNTCTAFIPNAGEIIIYDCDALHSYERFKIGDGIHSIVELPFAVDSVIQSMLHIEKNIIYADAGRITEYEEQLPDNQESEVI